MGESNVIEVYIRYLRLKIEDEATDGVGTFTGGMKRELGS